MLLESHENFADYIPSEDLSDWIEDESLDDMIEYIWGGIIYAIWHITPSDEVLVSSIIKSASDELKPLYQRVFDLIKKE